MSVLDLVCVACRAGLHDECAKGWDGELAEEAVCCCDGTYTLENHFKQMLAEQLDGGSDDYLPPSSPPAPAEPKQKQRGFSGYIHPDAWPSERDIGSLTDPESTGRKRAAQLYPISVGQVCEWAGKKDCGAGPVPIVGCMNNPATDIQHGPDKNTLNNAKASHGIGDTENIWLICAECHNAWHAKNDPYYPERDWVEDQAIPWLPTEPYPLVPMVDASFDELLAEEKRRHEQRQARGKVARGRNAKHRGVADTTLGE